MDKKANYTDPPSLRTMDNKATGTGHPSLREQLEDPLVFWPNISIKKIKPCLEQNSAEGYGQLVHRIVNESLRYGKEIKTKKEVIRALFLEDFPVEPGWFYAGGRSWRYVEVAARLRLLFNALYIFAVTEVEERQKNNMDLKKHKTTQVNKRASKSYLDLFFAHLELKEDTWTETRIPQAEREILADHQEKIDIILNKHPGKFIIPRDVDHFDKVYLHPKNKLLASSASNPSGPVSLEVAFINALQTAGIDLVRLAEFREARNMKAPPSMFTSASFPEGTGEEEFASLLNEQCGWYNSKRGKDILHSTIRTHKRQAMQTPIWGTAGVGVFVGIDLLGDMGFPTDDEDRESWRYFSFAFHPADSATTAQITSHDVKAFPPHSDTYPKEAPTHDQLKQLSNNELEEQKVDKVEKPKVGAKTGHTYSTPTPSKAKAKKTGNNQGPKKETWDKEEIPQSTKKGPVWPHCHQGFWETDSFNQMFLDQGLAKPLWDPKYKLPQYIQVVKHHTYILAEGEVIRQEANRIKKESKT